MIEPNIFDILCLGCQYKYPPKKSKMREIWENGCGWCFKKLWNVEKCPHELSWNRYIKRL